MPRLFKCNRHGLRGLEGLLSEVADSYKQLKPLVLCSYDIGLTQVGYRSCCFKASIILRIERGNTVIIIYVCFMIFIQGIYTYIFIRFIKGQIWQAYL